MQNVKTFPAQPFSERFRSLVWSNPEASPETILRAALLRPTFDALLSAALEFGVDHVEQTWAALKISGEPEVERAAPITERMLRHIREGYRQATMIRD